MSIVSREMYWIGLWSEVSLVEFDCRHLGLLLVAKETTDEQILIVTANRYAQASQEKRYVIRRVIRTVWDRTTGVFGQLPVQMTQ